MKLLVILSSLLAYSLGQVVYYTAPYNHYSHYNHFGPYGLVPTYATAPLTHHFPAPFPAPIRAPVAASAPAKAAAAAPPAPAAHAPPAAVAAPVATPVAKPASAPVFAQAPVPAPFAAPVALTAAAPIVTPIASQFHAQDELGQFTFATSGDNQARVETKTLDGTVRGAYSYIDAAGKLVNVQYLADDSGFRVLGANNLPEAPAPTRLKGPEPVKDTPEVEAARAEFQKKFAEAAAAAAAAAPEGEGEGEAHHRRRRQILFAPPVAIPAPAPARVQQLQPVEGARVPASTSKAELKEREEQVAVGAPLAYASYAAAPHVVAAVPSPVATNSLIPGPTFLHAPAFYSAAPQVLATPAIAAPAVAKTTVKIQQYEPVHARVPASTQKVELREREHEVLTPLSAPLPYYNPYIVV